MLFTEANLKNFRITKSGNFKKNCSTYYYHYACDVCGYPFLQQKGAYGVYCSFECAIISEKYRKNKSNSCKNRTFTTSWRENISSSKKGKPKAPWTDEQRLKLSGPNSPHWIDGRAKTPYCPLWSDKEYKHWITHIRDGKCYGPNCSGKYIHNLVPHHINYDKKDCRPINLITLCTSCNSKANYNREWHQIYYAELIQILL
ncbi:hypothetical protein M0R04_16250 [Candidatus Dojkabacteria bacterium]|jgi:hypothetical protein|nr:hypothetical protein [Candidatus Dojkabacteria bacterium]